MIGRLDRHGEIQANVGTAVDARGQPVPDWKVQATRWMRVQDNGGRELWRARQLNPMVTCLVELRPWKDLSPKHRLIVGGRTLNVDHILKGERRGDFWLVACTEQATE